MTEGQTAASIVSGDPAPEPVAPVTPTETAQDSLSQGKDSSPWYSQIEDPDLRGFAELRQWESPADAVKSYRELDKLRGVPETELIRMPKDPEQKRAVMARLGMPDSPDGYEIENLSDDQLTWFRDAAHKSGLTADQAKALSAEWESRQTQTSEVAKAQYVQKCTDDMNELTKEWGEAAGHNLKATQEAARRLGLNEESLSKMESSMGTKAMMTMLAEYGNATREAGFVAADPIHTGKSLGMTPEAAKVTAKQMMGDPDFLGRYMSNDDAIRMAAVKEYEKVVSMYAG